MGFAQIALDPPPSVRQTNEEEKVPQTIQASPYTPRQTWGKMPLWKQHISKRGFPKNETCVSLSSPLGLKLIPPEDCAPLEAAPGHPG